MGDVGYVDEDGFLSLTDGKAFTIIYGGVNIYPQETESVLTLHPAIHDVAVAGEQELIGLDLHQTSARLTVPGSGASREKMTVATVIW